MRAAAAGRLLLWLGLVIGLVAAAGLLVGFEPATLPPALLNVAAYKLTFLAALGLLAAGAMFLRHARRTEACAPAVAAARADVAGGAASRSAAATPGAGPPATPRPDSETPARP